MPVGTPASSSAEAFSTGIGSAVIHNGVLLPNTEFGHIEVGGKEAEHRAASSIRGEEGWATGWTR